MSYIETFNWILKRLPKRRAKQFWILFLVMSISAILETMALASIAFFASAVADPEVVLTSRYIERINQYLNTQMITTANGIIVTSGIVMLSLVIIKNALKGVIAYTVARFSALLEAYFGKILLSGFLNMNYQWHLAENTANLVLAMDWRVYFGRNFIRQVLQLLNDFLMISVMLVALIVVQPMISMIVLCIIGGASALIFSGVRRRLDKISISARDYKITINKEATMAIHGVKDVKILRKEERFIDKFLEKALPLARIYGLQQIISELPVYILETTGFIVLTASIWSMMIFSGFSTAVVTGTTALLAVTAWKALPAVSRILGSLTNLRKSLPFINSQIDYINQIENSIGLHLKHVNKENVASNFNKEISFIDVNFTYNKSDSAALKKLNFTIKKGETIGIIGESGAGKSTLVELIIGLFSPTKGNILIDGKILNNDLVRDWLSLIGYVPQAPYICDGTLVENVAFGVNPNEIDRKRVTECCTMASMQDFIHRLPDGIDSFIGERGVKLSGGQRQRVAIARALYNRPEVLIFDEATSSLDTKSERAIQETIYSFKGKQTLVIIAHRLSTVKNCDRIIWLDDRTIKLIGSPEKVIDIYEESNATDKYTAERINFA